MADPLQAALALKGAGQLGAAAAALRELRRGSSSAAAARYELAVLALQQAPEGKINVVAG